MGIRDAGTDDVFGPEQSEEEFEAAVAANPEAPASGAWWRCRTFIQKVLEAADSRLLVHCAIGVNRSATIVIAHLMETRQWTVRQALGFVKEKRYFVNPAPLHMQQLYKYQDQLGLKDDRL